MSARGKFIVIEGIDGSGKGTQVQMLARALAEREISFSRVSFPNYSGFFGKLVGKFLNGEFGPLDAVDPHFSALLYANDRLEARPGLEAALAAGEALLSDRYIASNMAHQGSRVAPEKRSDFLEWLRKLEYEMYGLPREDRVIYLRVPPAEAHRLIGEKAARDYTNLRHDLQEANFAHLEAASGVYDQLSAQENWTRIECFDSAAGVLRTPMEIHAEVLAILEADILATPRKRDN
jgi:dTMP kinase